jgi:hypothetical protein
MVGFLLELVFITVVCGTSRKKKLSDKRNGFDTKQKQAKERFGVLPRGKIVREIMGAIMKNRMGLELWAYYWMRRRNPHRHPDSFRRGSFFSFSYQIGLHAP